MIDAQTCHLVIGAMTVMMEAEGEPYEGKLAVAWVLRNRGHDTISVALRPYQFSCWLPASPTLKRIGPSVLMGGPAWQESVRAMESAYLGTAPDPTGGATHYLQRETVMRQAGRLPSWFDEGKVTVVIGRHTFLKGV